MSESLARTVASNRVEMLLQKIMNACLEVKGKEVVGLDVRGIFELSDYFVVASGRSDRQVQGISNKILALLEEEGIDVVSIEGFDEGHWVLIDSGDIVVHVFYEPMREHYDIESLWARAKHVNIAEPPKSDRAAA